ncbi:hypothetical protein N7468_007081 [Penicillium chermesinum]|uniref:PH domain-containing protein n=1 Tax=Penicillium chermesinum TaxID=63820 RepID=A0A9W9NTF1_9EURO|nr:uncharacterized protein N7468_007081 [Penicillium chermesinum]KAJ5225856.1 hypothetical protein N7468_007081 [Penicillium chermesinum]
MSNPAGQPDVKLPSRSGTVTSNLTRRTSNSDDEAIPDSDSGEVCYKSPPIGQRSYSSPVPRVERLRAWKHLCGNLEDYVSMHAKVAKSHSKDYEKILKIASEPLKESHHFSTSDGGVASLFEKMRTNSQGIVNMYLETEKSLTGSILPTLTRLHKEIKGKSKELTTGAAKGAKAVEKARGVTQKHIELLGQNATSFDTSIGKIDPTHDPYVLKRGTNHRLNKQVAEENNHRQDILAVQNSFQQFEAYILQTIQTVLDNFFQLMGGQMDRQRAMYGEILATAQRIPPDFEWINFCMNNDTKLVNPDSPPRDFASISYPNQNHRSTQPLIEGALERRSRAMIKGYNNGYYVVTPARYLHEFKDNDDFRRDPTPELSLYLPDCVVGAIDGAKFNVKGKDVSNGKVGNAFHTNTELSFKARSPSDAEKWWSVIKDCTRAGAPAPSSDPTGPSEPGNQPPPTYAAGEQQAAPSAAAAAAPASDATAHPAGGSGNPSAATDVKTPVGEKEVSTPAIPKPTRTASSGSYFTGPSGSAVGEKS